jgi:hypothetical protein
LIGYDDHGPLRLVEPANRLGSERKHTKTADVI